jgi:hypothetical protein
LAIEVGEILQALLERAQIWRFFFGVSRVPQNADSRDSFALLRPCHERPRDRRANQAANKLATPHAIPRRINKWAKAVYAGAIAQSSDG